jgi:hypothetical protein
VVEKEVRQTSLLLIFKEIDRISDLISSIGQNVAFGGKIR